MDERYGERSKVRKRQYKNLKETCSTPTSQLQRKNLLCNSKLKHLISGALFRIISELFGLTGTMLSIFWCIEVGWIFAPRNPVFRLISRERCTTRSQCLMLHVTSLSHMISISLSLVQADTKVGLDELGSLIWIYKNSTYTRTRHATIGAILIQISDPTTMIFKLLFRSFAAVKYKLAEVRRNDVLFW